ncbi:LAETG motif-containing sortase-dependent surface protein [Streptomyces sp. NPDC020096]
MKLRRVLVTVVSTAAIAPAALIAAPAAFADTSASPTPSARATAADTPTATPSDAPSAATTSGAPVADSTPTPTTDTSTSPSSQPSSGTSTAPQPSLTACADANPAKLVCAISGLPGKIVAGSGWHTFTMTVTNPTATAAHDVSLWAGIGPTDIHGQPFSTSQATLQDYNENTKQWENISYRGYAFGYVGWTDLDGHSRVTVPLRLSVGPNAPIGKGLTVAGGDYLDMKNDCLASSQIIYKIDIVAPGTDTTGSKPVPQTGGHIPLPKSTPTKTSATKVTATTDQTTPATGSLAHTGAPSQLPMIAGAAAAAIAAGAGAMLVVRRRKATAHS